MDERDGDDRSVGLAGGVADERRRAGAVSFEELSAGLVWPHLLRAVGYSLRVDVLLLGFLAALWVFGGGWLLEAGWRGVSDGAGPFGLLRGFWPTGGAIGIGDRFLIARGESGSGWTLVLFVLWVAPALGLVGTAASRLIALDFCAGRRLPLFGAVRFAVARAGSVLVFALAGPAIVAALVVVLWVYGLVFFTTDAMGVVGALLFGLALVIGLAAVSAGVVWLAGFCMMPGALAVEATDGTDALQRSLSYITSRTVRFSVYLALAGVVLAVSYAVVQELVRVAIGLAGGVSGADGVPAGSVRAWLLEGWVQTVWLVFIGWVIGYLMSVGTILYLVMRRVVDGHDVREVWVPGGSVEVDGGIGQDGADSA